MRGVKHVRQEIDEFSHQAVSQRFIDPCRRHSCRDDHYRPDSDLASTSHRRQRRRTHSRHQVVAGSSRTLVEPSSEDML